LGISERSPCYSRGSENVSGFKTTGRFVTRGHCSSTARAPGIQVMTENEKSEYDPTQRLSFKEKLGYGLGDTASNFFFQVFNIFLLYYYTDVFGIDPALVGVMFIVTKVVDAISDPLMGIIADRTNSRWGKFRPYLLWGAIPYGVLGYAMFAGPELSDVGKLAYAYVTYTLMMLAYTVINIPYSALMGVMSSNSLERTSLSSYRFVCAFSAAWIIGTFVTPLKTILGGGDEGQGFRLTMMLFAVLSIALFWVTFATTRERVKPLQEKADLKLDFQAMLANAPWLALFFAAIFTLMNVAVRNGAIMYYFKYYVGDDGSAIFLIFDQTAVFMSLGLFAMITGIACTKALASRFDKRQLLIVLSILNALLMAVFFFIPPDRYWLMVIVNMLSALVIGPTPALVWAMYADTADYGEWKSGRRTTGLVFSALQFAQKLGLAVGAGLSGIILSLFGFIANQPQTEAALTGIRLMFSIFPAGLALAGVVAVLFYPLRDKKVKEIEAELNLRHGYGDEDGAAEATV
jgi:GPH family glycoside/pentoside/hexuronide:cation symporter